MNKDNRKKSSPGISYEGIVADIHRQFAQNAVITENEIVIGKSGRERQIDVTLRTDIAGYELLVIIECKDYKRRVEIGKVDELIGKIDDVGAAKGVLVSDSGFAVGAIERAKSDSRVQLASVIDTANGKLRSTITLPVGFQYHQIDFPYSLNIEVVSSNSQHLMSPHFTDANRIEMKMHELKIIQESQIIDLTKKFYAWLNDGKCNELRAGNHQFDHDIVNSGGSHVVARTNFTKTIRQFVNENVYAKGVGIYDHVSKRIISGDSNLKSIHLDRDEIFATWREVPEGYVLKDCQTYYALVACYNIEAAEDQGRQMFAALRSTLI